MNAFAAVIVPVSGLAVRQALVDKLVVRVGADDVLAQTRYLVRNRRTGRRREVCARTLAAARRKLGWTAGDCLVLSESEVE